MGMVGGAQAQEDAGSKADSSVTGPGESQSFEEANRRYEEENMKYCGGMYPHNYGNPLANVPGPSVGSSKT